MASPNPVTENIRGVQNLVESDENKLREGAANLTEGIDGEKTDVLSLDMGDDALIRLARSREIDYAKYEAKIKPKQDENKKYYLGDQLQGSEYLSDYPIATNLLFEAEETFLPAALSKNPEPVVYSDNTPEGNRLSSSVKTMLQYHADSLVLRAKLKQVVRQWSIYYLGVMKHGWDADIEDIRSDVRKIQDFVFDPEGAVDAYGDFDSWLGERITVTAEKLIEMYPEHRAYITVMVDGQLGTKVTYTEWWEDTFTYTTFKDIVLDKAKNPLFNYPEEETDEFGLPMESEANNHFAKPKKPYTFLSVFSLGEQPHDITGLIEQNIPNQNLVSRRIQQIDYNLSKANNSDVFSAENFTEQTARQAATAMAKGTPILVPEGKPISEAIARLQAPGIDGAYFNDLAQNMNNLRSIFGTQGITASDTDQDETARGMILNQQYDNTRIGGGIGERVEQFADNVFNWWVQLYYVFYDERHTASILGKMKAVEYVVISNSDLDRQLIVSVAADSMKPKDELTQMNQALELWQQGALDPKTLLTVLNFPDPNETAAQVWLWRTNPQLYGQLNFPNLQELIAKTMPAIIAQQAQMGAMGGAQPVAEEVPGGAPAAVEGQQPQSLGAAPASASLSNVPLPPIGQ